MDYETYCVGMVQNKGTTKSELRLRLSLVIRLVWFKTKVQRKGAAMKDLIKINIPILLQSYEFGFIHTERLIITDGTKR